MYAPLLTGLAQACGELILLARSNKPMSDEERDEQARRLFAPCYELRHRLELVADPEVAAPAIEYFRSARRLRNFVASGQDPNNGWLERYDDEVGKLRSAAIAAMRVDLTPSTQLAERKRQP